jgi:hypothetical protein
MKIPWRHKEDTPAPQEDAIDSQLDVLFDTTFTLLDNLQNTTVKVRKQLETTREVSRQYSQFKKNGDTSQ